MTVKNSVRVYRERSGLTQEELARAAGVSRQTVIALERGSYAPSVTLALRLAGVFGVAVEKLFSLAG